MSHLDSQFADAAAQLSDDLADTLGYSPDGTAPVTVVAIVGQEETRSVMEQDGLKTRYVRTVSLPRTAAAAGGGSFVADVRLHDQLTIDGVVYTVETIASQTPTWTRLEAQRLAVREKTRQGYRRST